MGGDHLLCVFVDGALAFVIETDADRRPRDAGAAVEALDQAGAVQGDDVAAHRLGRHAEVLGQAFDGDKALIFHPRQDGRLPP